MQVTTKFLITSALLWVAAMIVWQLKVPTVEAGLSLEEEREPLTVSCDSDSGHGPASEGWWPGSGRVSAVWCQDKAVRPALAPAEELSAVSPRHLSEGEDDRWIP